MRRLVQLAAACVVALTAMPVSAQLDFSGEDPRVFSIQERPYRLGHEFQLGMGVLPLDAFYTGAVATASYTYHFSDFWGWEIATGGYSLNFDSGLEDDLLEEYGVRPARGGGERLKVLASTNGVIKPLFGKLAFFNSKVLYAETFFVAGGGPVLKGEYWRFAMDVGLGIRFWVGDSMAIRLDIRDYLIFVKTLPENALFVLISASFNYYSPPPSVEGGAR